MGVIKNLTKQKCKDGEVTLGSGVRMANTVEVGLAMKASGYDWLFIDLEHGPFNLETAQQISIAALTQEITPLVRVADLDPHLSTRILDSGAQGIILPHVDTAKELIERAKEFHQKDQEDISERIKELGLQDSLINLKGLTPGMLVTLGEQKILTLEDFADLASDELTGGYDVVKGERVKIQGYLEDFALSKEEADELIMSARNIVYKD